MLPLGVLARPAHRFLRNNPVMLVTGNVAGTATEFHPYTTDEDQ
jgi:hypothetical protein